MTGIAALFGLTVPVVQAPIGSCATPDLVAAVSEAGGLGSLACTWMPAADVIAAVQGLNRRGLAYFANFVLHFPRTDMLAILDARPRAITLSWGVDPDLIAAARTRGVIVGVQVGHPLAIQPAIAAGAQFIIAQGTEAGGHVQSTWPLAKLLPEAVAAAGAVPIAAAGGIADGAGVAAVLRQGASAAVLGTRFVATTESAAHPLYKQALVDASAADTVFTNCFDGGWPYAMHRVLRNPTLEQWEAAGCPLSPHRPGEGDTTLTHASGATTIRYADMPPLATDKGAALDACLYAGTGVGLITGVPSASEVVRRIAADLAGP